MTRTNTSTRPDPNPARLRRGRRPVAPTGGALILVLIVVVVAGLAIDAWVHLDLASNYDSNSSRLLGEGNLFRAEGAVAIVAATALLARPGRYTALFALVVAAAGTAAVLIWTYLDVGAFGPFPNMYEPVWYAKKTLSAWGEGVAAVAALPLLFLVGHPWPRLDDPTGA